MIFDDIKVSIKSGLGAIFIGPGDGRNALRPHTLREICSAVDHLTSESSVHAIILTGADFSFLQDLIGTAAVAVRDRIYDAF